METSAKSAADGAVHANGTALSDGASVDSSFAVHQPLLPAPDFSTANGPAEDQRAGDMPAGAPHSTTASESDGQHRFPSTTTTEAPDELPQRTDADGSTMPPECAVLRTPGVPAGDGVAADSWPSLGTLSTQERRRSPAAEQSAVKCDGSSALSHVDDANQATSATEAEAHSTFLPDPVSTAAMSNGSSAAAAPAGQPSPHAASAVNAPGSEPVLAGSVPDSADSEERVDVIGPVTPGTVAALANLLSAVSIRGTAATPPSATRKQDTAVGLVYDEAMELHHGPPSASVCSQ